MHYLQIKFSFRDVEHMASKQIIMKSLFITVCYYMVLWLWILYCCLPLDIIFVGWHLDIVLLADFRYCISWLTLDNAFVGWYLDFGFLLELSISSSSFEIISHPGSDEIWWIMMNWDKIHNYLEYINYFFIFDRLKETTEKSFCFFNNFLSLIDLLARIEPR